MSHPDALETQDDGLPHVAKTGESNIGAWVFGIALLLGGIWLFTSLNANRVEMQNSSPLIDPQSSGQRITASPALSVPRSFLAGSNLEDRPVRLRRVASLPAIRPVNPAAPIVYPVVPPSTFIPPDLPPQNADVPPIQTAPSVVFDSTIQTGDGDSAQAAASGRNRVTADRFAKPSQTIPQGTVIPAVLETALDSTRPGAARALVQRDIYSFDGTRILIQRGSRLYGEYDSGLAAGQNRALIQWTRLIRPDGVTIALDSPSSDRLGRAGVKGKVDSNFFQRFGGAILQSVLDLGVGLATQEIGSGVVVALPGSTQNLQLQNGNQVQRTLKVKHGTSVSVFVARDLDFSTVDF